MNIIQIYHKTDSGIERLYFSINFEHSKLRLRLVYYTSSSGETRRVWFGNSFPMMGVLPQGVKILPRRPTVSAAAQAKLREKIASIVSFEFPMER